KLDDALTLRDKRREAEALYSIGWIYFILGQNTIALDYYQKALDIQQAMNDKLNSAYSLGSMGWSYYYLQQYDDAINLHHRALDLRHALNDLEGVAFSLGGLGKVYEALGEYQKAIDLHLKQLEIARQVGNIKEEAYALSDLGFAYSNQGQYQTASRFYQQALALQRHINDRWGERITLAGIADSFEKAGDIELSILFFKESVNISESIRNNIVERPRSDRQAFLKTVEKSYRDLARLLLEQDRIIEAQQVLDLLKVQELEGYLLHNMRGDERISQGIEMLQAEKDILDAYNQFQRNIIDLGLELRNLRSIPIASRTESQQQRISLLTQLEHDINVQFNQFIDSSEIQELVSRLSFSTSRQNVNLEDLNLFRNQLQDSNSALIYPLVLEDRLELIIVTPHSPPLRRTVLVPREELREVVNQFRGQLLPQYNQSIKVSAQKLYDWLIRPVEEDLNQANIDTIIFAPDGILRYIPLTALHNGHEWLIEKYKVNYITARSLTNFDTPPNATISALAGAFVEGLAEFTVGERSFRFSGLPFAGREIETLVDILPDSTKLVDDEFSVAAVLPQLNDYSIVHFATHAEFIAGQPEDSFIVFGSGERVTLADIKNWSLPFVDLVVLSACKTGVGGLGNGEEVLGLGYQFQRAGAKAVIASLWAVNDQSTQELMISFYQSLQQGMTKNEALRAAQISLLNSHFNHPYYWAPFILIGNGL
ncbi:MAG: CHAT domain-containing protein, partial [Prochlorothrix sp.]|nr:CHAT domain-containing protein [Prochlorothrix sp.]